MVWSWLFKFVHRGTKGDNGSSKDLGGAKKVKDSDGNEKFEVEVPTAREDVDQLWNASRAALAVVPPQEKEHRDAATKQADHDRNSRTNVVLAWTGTNMYVISIVFYLFVCLFITFCYRVMILVFTSNTFNDWVKKHVELSQDTTFNPYLTFLFYAMWVTPFFLFRMLTDTFG